MILQDRASKHQDQDLQQLRNGPGPRPLTSIKQDCGLKCSRKRIGLATDRPLAFYIVVLQWHAVGTFCSGVQVSIAGMFYLHGRALSMIMIIHILVRHVGHVPRASYVLSYCLLACRISTYCMQSQLTTASTYYNSMQ